MKRPRKCRLLAAHNRGLLAFLCGAMTAPPAKGNKGTAAAAFRAGWHSAQAALSSPTKAPAA